ncbi:MAG: winged helix-turn-helix transcriptional regulator [Bernardetiaceae bacterium]|nr:winged helix-turn-helix transcriptional regulator [Bernardetiaceae bacterium]
MGASKSSYFTASQNELARCFKALAHPARIAIIAHLLEVEACVCGDIVEKLPLSQPTVSQHLRELKEVGLIKGSIEGNRICYCLDKTAFANMQHYFDLILQHKNASECC